MRHFNFSVWNFQKKVKGGGCTMILVILSLLAAAQTAQRDSVMQKLKDMAVAYRNANHLSFDATYLYANEDKPAVYLDSLKGSFKVHGNRYAYILDNTEFLGNDSLNLVVFNEDKIIYVNGPSIAQSANPLAMIDSVMMINQYSNVTLTSSGNIQKITIDFSPGFMFKKAEYIIDPVSGLITRMKAIIHSVEMYDPAVKPMFNKTAEYGILEVRFSNYKTNAFTDAAFSETRYILKSGHQYKGAAAYSNYQILNGSIR